MTEYRYYNNEVKTHKAFRKKVEEVLENADGDIKTPEIQAEITGDKHEGWSKPSNPKSDTDGWSSEWTRNILYDIRNWLKDNREDFSSKEEKGPGQDHIYWRIEK